MMEAMTARERIEATVRCEKPDHVPIIPMVDFFIARQKGITLETFINDNDLGRDLILQYFDEVGGWDALFQSTTLNEFAFSLTLPMRLKVPGRELGPDEVWQFDEVPVLGEEDYDLAIAQGYQAISGKIWPSIRSHWHPSEFPGRLDQWLGQAVKDTLICEARGLDTFTGVAISPPFDFFSMGRSLKEFTFDLYRRPEKVLAAIEAITPGLIETAVGGQMGMRHTTKYGYMTNFIGATREAGTFVSPKVFEKFAWPSIRQIALALLEAGITPLFHFDSDWGPMLEFFKDLPKGKCVLELDGATDIFRAKKMLNGHMCLMGDVPAALLTIGTPDDVCDYVKKLCEVVGDGGGFILSTGCDTPVNAKAENVRAMLDAGRTFGAYH